jgi:cyclic pyranopterin phosphate synthase
VFNINEPRDYANPKHFAKVIRNVELAIRKGFVVGLGFNVWRPDFDTSFMPELAYRFGRSSFRWTLANPQLNSPSNVVHPGDFKLVAERCVDMLRKAASLGIEAMLDCSLPLCFFKEEDLAWVRQYHAGTASRLGICEPILDVTPELDVLRCFALSTADRRKVTDFRNEYEIRQWFLDNTDSSLRMKGCFTHCLECVHHQEGRCQGGCLAWNDGIAQKDVSSNPLSLTDSMNAAIQSDHPEIALENYDSATRPFKTAETTYLAAVSALRLGKSSKAFRYAAYAQDVTTDIALKKRINELMAEIPSREDDETADTDRTTVSLPFVACPGQGKGPT